jgi:HKD family nuclease
MTVFVLESVSALAFLPSSEIAQALKQATGVERLTVEVTTVTTADQSLLEGVRSTLVQGGDSLLCVAFAHARGVHLLEKELKVCGRTRLLATTTFERPGNTALSVATSFGAEVRILNPGSGSTYHPKVYLGRHGRNGARVRAFVGSANLTGGLATNVEVGVILDGKLSEPELRKLWDWGESMWEDTRVEPFAPAAADAEGDDELEPVLLQRLEDAVARSPVFETLGTRARNEVLGLSRSEVLVSTGRSDARGFGAHPIPAWMFNLAWEWLHKRGELTNKMLLKTLRVHRSSAVCAILARLDGVTGFSKPQVGVRLVPDS